MCDEDEKGAKESGDWEIFLVPGEGFVSGIAQRPTGETGVYMSDFGPIKYTSGALDWWNDKLTPCTEEQAAEALADGLRRFGHLIKKPD